MHKMDRRGGDVRFMWMTEAWLVPRGGRVVTRRAHQLPLNMRYVVQWS